MLSASNKSAVAVQTPLFEDYSDELLNFASASCIVFIIVGVPSNLLTITALLRGKQTRNSTAVFIVNLSLSDLLFGCFNLPLAASTFLRRAWIHSVTLCRLFPLLRYGLLAVSLFTVSLITINRYIIIAHPRQYPRIYQHKYLALMVTATWLAAFSIMIPTWRGIWGEFGLDISIGSCSILPDRYGRSPKEFLFLIAFLLPCLCIVFCYARIFYLVRRAAWRTRDTGISKSCSFLEQQPKSNASTISAALTKKTAAVENNTAKSKKHLSSKCDNFNGVSATVLHDDDDDAYEDGMRPFFIDEDIEYIDVSDSNDDYITPKQYSATPPQLNKDRNHSNCVDHDTITPPKDEGKKKLADKAAADASNRGNDIASTLKTSFNRFNARKTQYVSMGNTSNASSIYPGKMSQKDRRLLKMIFIIFVSFVICYLPITVTKTFKSLKDRHILNISGYLLIYLTTCLNPLIYVLISSEYRQAYWSLLKCQPVEQRKNNYKRRAKP